MGGYPQRVVGPNSSQPTLFGVIGMFHESNKFQALQKVVELPSHYKLPKVIHGSSELHTERRLLGPSAKTHIPGLHYGMTPFAGRFMSHSEHIEVYKGHHSERNEEKK